MLGMRPVSGEFYVGTPEGVLKIRTVRRVLIDKRWDINLLNTFKGSPWDLKATQAQELPADRQLQPIPLEAAIPQAEESGGAIERRDFKIFKSDIQKYGGTANCPGCMAAGSGVEQRPHTVQCRDRFRKLFLDSDVKRKRIIAADNRLKRIRTVEGQNPAETSGADVDIGQGGAPAASAAPQREVGDQGGEGCGRN